jgi:hypothetical protein
LKFASKELNIDERVQRALNQIKKPSSAEEITALANRDLGPKDRPFQVGEVSTWLRNASDRILNLYWLENRLRKPVVSFVNRQSSRLFRMAVRKTLVIEAVGHRIRRNTGPPLGIDGLCELLLGSHPL